MEYRLEYAEDLDLGDEEFEALDAQPYMKEA